MESGGRKRGVQLTEERAGGGGGCWGGEVEGGVKGYHQPFGKEGGVMLSEKQRDREPRAGPGEK